MIYVLATDLSTRDLLFQCYLPACPRVGEKLQEKGIVYLVREVEWTAGSAAVTLRVQESRA